NCVVTAGNTPCQETIETSWVEAAISIRRRAGISRGGMRSITVIGGGLIGAASALRLLKAEGKTTLIDPGDKRRAASFGNAGHIGSEQVMPWSTWANLAGAVTHLYGLGGPLDFRWSDIASWLPWSLRFMAASDARRVAQGQGALTTLL